MNKNTCNTKLNKHTKGLHLFLKNNRLILLLISYWWQIYISPLLDGDVVTVTISNLLLLIGTMWQLCDSGTDLFSSDLKFLWKKILSLESILSQCVQRHFSALSNIAIVENKSEWQI